MSIEELPPPTKIVDSLHERADLANDAWDHDEMHAAAEVLAHDPAWAVNNVYVSRWIAGLRLR